MFAPTDERQYTVWAREFLYEPAQEGDVSEKMERLRSLIRYNDWKYYVKDEPVLSDSEYDALFAQLKDWEKQRPDLIVPDSPTQRIASGISEAFKTVPHLVPMLSLENSYNAADLLAWDQRCKDATGLQQITYTVEPKYDGAGISLVYEDDRLQRGATRGDGIMGEDITTNIKQIKSIPLSAGFKQQGVQSIEIRGEVLIRKEVFKKYNAQRTAEGLPPLANPRNAASGTLRMLDPREVAKRGLNAMVYHVSYHTLAPGAAEPEILGSHFDTLEWLSRAGFNSPSQDMKRCRSIEEAIEVCETFEAKRDELPYEIDGMVVKVDQLELQERLGMTTHHPRWAIAFKFQARQGTSRLLRVEFQVGRTGSITPVAKIEPVAIGGVMVSSVSLFNEEAIREKDLRIGDTILVERAGDVIPYIVKAHTETRTGDEKTIEFPTHCPVCHQELYKPEDEAAWRCINANCPAQVVERIVHFASKDAMDIRSLGVSNIKRFYELGIFSDIAGIYHIDWEQLNGLEGIGAKSIANLKKAIEDSKQQPLHRLLFGLGIRYVGETTAKTLARAVPNLKDFTGWSIEQLCTLEDVGPKVAGSVHQFFNNPENLHLLAQLEKEGLKLEQDATDKSTGAGSLQGTTFLFTGTLNHLKRSEAEREVEELGGKIVSGVSSKLNYLVVGEEAGSKLEKAKKLGTVNLLTEQEFLRLIEKERRRGSGPE